MVTFKLKIFSMIRSEEHCTLFMKSPFWSFLSLKYSQELDLKDIVRC